MSEPLNSAPRIDMEPSTTPAPPWTGVKFTCEKCRAEYQLEAGDKCELRLIVKEGTRAYDTPPCFDCGHVNIIEIDSNEPEEAGGS